MANLNLYVVRDNVAGVNELILTAKNDEVLKRSVKGVLLSREQNYLNTDTRDKDIYLCGVLNTDNGVIDTINPTQFVCGVEQLRLELVAEIRAKREEAGLPPEEGVVDESTSGN